MILKDAKWTICILLGTIIVFGAFLRFYQLPQNPPGFFCDEAANGYNAYCISRNLRSEYGVLLPAFFRTFGSWRGGAFIYLCVPAVKLLGLSEFTVRGTAAAIGVLTIFLIYLLAKEVFSRSTALLAALFLAICPWHFFFSRVGFELISLPLFFTAALYFFFRAINGRSPRTSLFVSGMCFALTIYTYHPAKMFIPLFLIVLALIYRKKLLSMKGATIVFRISILIFLIPCLLVFLGHKDRITKRFHQVSVFRQKATPAEYARIISHNYLDTFSYRFLFKEGDRFDRSVVRGFGPLHKFQLPFIILGLALFLWQRKKPQQALIAWLLLFSMPDALVYKASPTRSILGVPLYPLIAAYGTTMFFSFFYRRRYLKYALYALVPAYIAIAACFSLRYFNAYFKEYPLYAGTSFTGWQYGPRDIFAYIKEVYDDHDEFSWQFEGRQPIHEPRALRAFYLYNNPYDKITFRGFSIFGPRKKQLFIVNVKSFEPFGPDNYRVHKEFLAPDGSPLYLAIQFQNAPFPPSEWLTSPLYDNTEGRGFNKAYSPETGRRAGIVDWKKTRSSLYGLIPLRDTLHCRDNFKCIYLLLHVESPERQDAQLRVGGTDSIKLWFNSKLLLEEAGEHVGKRDDYIIPVKLSSGDNTVLIKSCVLQNRRWDVFLRITDEEGNNIDNLTYDKGGKA